MLTSLYNYATPLLGYELGDYAEVGGPCACGNAGGKSSVSGSSSGAAVM